MQSFICEAIRDLEECSGETPQLARPIDVVSSLCLDVCLDIALVQHSWMW